MASAQTDSRRHGPASIRQISDLAQPVANRDAGEAHRLNGLNGGAQERWGASHERRRICDIMSVKNQPPVAIARLAQHVLKFVRRQGPVVKLDDLEMTEIDGPDVDPIVYSAATVEPFLELKLARQGNPAERITKIRQMDITAQSAQKLFSF